MYDFCEILDTDYGRMVVNKSDVPALQAQIEAMGYSVERMHTDFLCAPL